MPAADLERLSRTGAVRREGHAPAHRRASVPVPERSPSDASASMSTQAGLRPDHATRSPRSTAPLAERIVTTSPDVTVSTNLGPWVNRRGLFARERMADMFRKERIASTHNWEFSPQGQHLELGIAEIQPVHHAVGAWPVALALRRAACCRSARSTIPSSQRGLDALNYACYQDARFLLVATPSGVTLAPEGGAHQSIGTPLIGMAQDGLAAFEPAFVDELAVIMRLGFDYMQRDGEGEPIRAHLAARRDRRLGLSAPLDAPARAAAARRSTPELAARHRRRRLLAAPAGPQRRGRRSPIRAPSRRRRSRPPA